MSDFRVVLPESEDGGERELDWNRSDSRWSLSDKEYGGVRWFEGQTPRPEDLAALTAFFRVQQAPMADVLIKLSPGELAYLHALEVDVPTVLATLCPSCGEHWTVYRKDDMGPWRQFGRTCDFSWMRGDVVEDSVVEARVSFRSAGEPEH